jgi:hypothetical protein
MLELEFFTHLDGTLVSASVEYKTIFDSDWFEVGEEIVWRNYHNNEWQTTYTINGRKYSPTKEEFKEWEKEINEAISKEAA